MLTGCFCLFAMSAGAPALLLGAPSNTLSCFGLSLHLQVVSYIFFGMLFFFFPFPGLVIPKTKKGMHKMTSSLVSLTSSFNLIQHCLAPVGISHGFLLQNLWNYNIILVSCCKICTQNQYFLKLSSNISNYICIRTFA